MEAREDICAFHNQGNVDVVLYGGSNLLRFYQPMEAWKEYGFTSFNYATSGASPDMMYYYAEESRKYSVPTLYVFDVRSFPGLGNEEFQEVSLRNWSDSLSPFSYERNKGILSYVISHDSQGIDIASLFLDIIDYHSNVECLKEKKQWEYLNPSKIDSIDKGFEPNLFCTPFKMPDLTKESGKLSDSTINSLNILLDYCEHEKMQSLFICCPFVVTQEERKSINSIGKIIRDRGFTFVDFNNFYNEIGLDFSTDFGDRNHLNYLGAEKYTDYLSKYLKDSFELPDHRSDPEYEMWRKDYLQYMECGQKWKTTVIDNVNRKTRSLEKGFVLHNENSFSKWFDQIEDENYSVIIQSKMQGYDGGDYALKCFLKKYGISAHPGDYMCIWKGEECVISACNNEVIDIDIGVDGGFGSDRCYMTMGDSPIIKISDTNYYNSDGVIYVIVYDNNFKIVLDNVIVKLDHDGNAYISR